MTKLEVLRKTGRYLRKSMSMSAREIEVKWVTKESESEAFSVSARKGGARVLETKGWTPGPIEMDDYGDAMFEPLTAVAVIVAVGWLIRRIADVLADVASPEGQLIDVRGHPAIVRPLPKAKPPGKLVIVTDQGPQVFPPERRDEGLALLKRLLGAGNGE
jgi:hypothetical protein